MINRRDFLAASTAAMLGHGGYPIRRQEAQSQMYGLIGRIVAMEGRREELAEILIEGVGGMPGCLSYVVAYDTEDANALWVTEVWDSEASHKESLALPPVQEAIQKGRPLIQEFREGFVTIPLGGYGLE